MVDVNKLDFESNEDSNKYVTYVSDNGINYRLSIEKYMRHHWNWFICDDDDVVTPIDGYTGNLVDRMVLGSGVSGSPESAKIAMGDWFKYTYMYRDKDGKTNMMHPNCCDDLGELVINFENMFLDKLYADHLVYYNRIKKQWVLMVNGNDIMILNYCPYCGKDITHNIIDE